MAEKKIYIEIVYKLKNRNISIFFDRLFSSIINTYMFFFTQTDSMFSLAKLAYVVCDQSEKEYYDGLCTPDLDVRTCCIDIVKSSIVDFDSEGTQCPPVAWNVFFF